jgi:hypothetical protein
VEGGWVTIIGARRSARPTGSYQGSLFVVVVVVVNFSIFAFADDNLRVVDAPRKVEQASLLLEAGASATIPTDTRMSCLHVAAANGDDAMAELLASTDPATLVMRDAYVFTLPLCAPNKHAFGGRLNMW